MSFWMRKEILFDFNGMPLAKGLPVLCPNQGKTIDERKLTVGTVLGFTSKDRVKVMIVEGMGQEIKYYNPSALFIYGIPSHLQDDYGRYCDRVAKRAKKEFKGEL